MLLDVFLGCLGALMFDRTIGAAMQFWSMRRVSRHICRNLDKSLEKSKMFRELEQQVDAEHRRKARAN